MSIEYDQYLTEHISNVQKALQWMRTFLPGSIIDNEAMTKAELNVEQHDKSKYSTDEYDAYDKYFYGGNRSFEVTNNFNYAWLHHIHNNPHHWQYWVLMNDDAEEGTQALEMPLEYIYEMIADWWSFSWKNSNLMEIYDWYKDHEKTMKLAPLTRRHVVRILYAILSVLQMQLIREGKWEDFSKKDDIYAMLGVPPINGLVAEKFFNI